jgi:hypothetical protein
MKQCALIVLMIFAELEYRTYVHYCKYPTSHSIFEPAVPRGKPGVVLYLYCIASTAHVALAQMVHKNL